MRFLQVLVALVLLTTPFVASGQARPNSSGDYNVHIPTIQPPAPRNDQAGDSLMRDRTYGNTEGRSLMAPPVYTPPPPIYQPPVYQPYEPSRSRQRW